MDNCIFPLGECKWILAFGCEFLTLPSHTTFVPILGTKYFCPDFSKTMVNFKDLNLKGQEYPKKKPPLTFLLAAGISVEARLCLLVSTVTVFSTGMLRSGTSLDISASVWKSKFTSTDAWTIKFGCSWTSNFSKKLYQFYIFNPIWSQMTLDLGTWPPKKKQQQ